MDASESHQKNDGGNADDSSTRAMARRLSPISRWQLRAFTRRPAAGTFLLQGFRRVACRQPASARAGYGSGRCPSVKSAARLTRSPLKTTTEIRSVTVISASGLPSTISRSASCPLATRPSRAPARSRRAAFQVAACSAADGGMPACDPELHFVLNRRPVEDERIAGVAAGDQGDAGVVGALEIRRSRPREQPCEGRLRCLARSAGARSRSILRVAVSIAGATACWTSDRSSSVGAAAGQSACPSHTDSVGS